MADKAISGMAELVAPAANDLLPVIDVSEALDVNKNKHLQVSTLDARYLLASGGTMTGDLTFSGAFHPVFSPGSDTDFNFLESDVTGSPAISWDESEDAVSLNCRLRLVKDEDWFEALKLVSTHSTNKFVAVQLYGANKWEFATDSGGNGTDDAYISGGVNGHTMLYCTPSRVDINAGQNNIDFRVKSDTNDNLIYADAGLDAVGIGIASPAAKLHVDQSSSTGAKPGLLVDQADTSEQCIKLSSDGADRDINLFTVDVTDTPTVSWDESEDKFSVNKGIWITSDQLLIRHGSSPNFYVWGDGSTAWPGVSVRAVVNSGYTYQYFDRGLGTDLDSPSVITSGTEIGRIAWRGYDSDSWVVGARITGSANQNWGAAAAGSKLEFSTCADGSQSLGTRIEIAGANLGFFGVTPVARQTGYTTFSNLSTDRTCDANSTTVEELADILGTLIEDLKSLGLISA